MNETLKRIGLELQRRTRHILRQPMNWRMIDVFVRLEETEEAVRHSKADAMAAKPGLSPGGDAMIGSAPTAPADNENDQPAAPVDKR